MKEISSKFLFRDSCKGQEYHTNHNSSVIILLLICEAIIRVLNWKNSQITNNYISGITKNSMNYRAILVSGAINLKIKYNRFENMNRPIQIIAIKNTGDGSIYSITYNSLTQTNFSDMKFNLCQNLTEAFVRYSNKYLDYSAERRIPLLT